MNPVTNQPNNQFYQTGPSGYGPSAPAYPPPYAPAQGPGFGEPATPMYPNPGQYYGPNQGYPHQAYPSQQPVYVVNQQPNQHSSTDRGCLEALCAACVACYCLTSCIDICCDH